MNVDTTCPMDQTEGEQADDIESWQLRCPECGGVFGTPPVETPHEPDELGL